jgi:hypothetical protein
MLKLISKKVYAWIGLMTFLALLLTLCLIIWAFFIRKGKILEITPKSKDCKGWIFHQLLCVRLSFNYEWAWNPGDCMVRWGLSLVRLLPVFVAPGFCSNLLWVFCLDESVVIVFGWVCCWCFRMCFS